MNRFESFKMDDETIDDLQLDGLMLIQKKSSFRFGVDAVLLSDFAKIKKGDKVLDIGTGTGIIPILLAAKTKADHITGLEIQGQMADMAGRSVKMNQLEHRVSIVHGDIKEWSSLFGKASFDVVVSNPPYIQEKAGMHNSNNAKSISRHEVKCTLDDVVAAAALLLSTNGRLAMIHRPHRLIDICEAFRANGIEPKLMRFVLSNQKAAPTMVLIQGTKHGRKELKVLENLVIFNEDGKYSEEINKIYGRSPKEGVLT